MCEATKNTPRKTFYRYFKPIALVGRASGVFPIKNLWGSNCDKLRFSFCSFPVLYTVFLFGSLIALLLYCTDWNFTTTQVTGSNYSAFMWLITLESMTTMYSFVSCFFCTWNARRFVKLIKLLDFFDKEKWAMYDERCSSEMAFVLKRTVRPLLLGILIMIVVIIGLVSFTKAAVDVADFNEFQQFSYVFFGILGVWQAAPMLYYLHFASAITENFCFINNLGRKLYLQEESRVLNSLQDQQKCVKNCLRNIRYLHILMCDAVKYLSLAYGPFLAVGQLYTIVTFALGFYLAVFTSINGVNLVIYVCVYCLLSIVVVLKSHKTRIEVRRSYFNFLWQHRQLENSDIDGTVL